MALPKRKVSRSRRDKRRTHWKLSKATIATCPQCHEAKLPHRACPNCGYYRGRPIISTQEK